VNFLELKNVWYEYYYTYWKGNYFHATNEKRNEQRITPSPSKISLGDTVCVGYINKAKGSRTYDLFEGKYYRCVGLFPSVILEHSET
jgi:hypothetical protein